MLTTASVASKEREARERRNRERERESFFFFFFFFFFRHWLWRRRLRPLLFAFSLSFSPNTRAHTRTHAHNKKPSQVILHTTSGDIDVELWPKEAPKAVRNFVQLCLEGYYDGCLFHRVISDLMIQSGDPTGTGLGGESVYGKPFGDELHSRLRFTRRGLVAAAGSSSSGGEGGGGGGKGSAAAPSSNSGNGSQFFITLGAAPHLDRRHTIFGRVAAGDTIYTVAAIGEAEVDEQDRPCSDPRPRIISTEVLWNPFEDIVPRTTAEERAARRAKEAKERRMAEERASKPGLVAVRDNKLLSFGEEFFFEVFF